MHSHSVFSFFRKCKHNFTYVAHCYLLVLAIVWNSILRWNREQKPDNDLYMCCIHCVAVFPFACQFIYILYEWQAHAMPCHAMTCNPTHTHTHTVSGDILFVCLLAIEWLSAHFVFYSFSFSFPLFLILVFFPLMQSAIETDIVIWYGRKLKFNYQMHSVFRNEWVRWYAWWITHAHKISNSMINLR